MGTKDRREVVDSPVPGQGLQEPLRLALRTQALELRVAAPATVLTYTPPNVVNVTLGYLPVQAINPPVATAPDEVPLPPVVVPNVRVGWMQGATHSDFAPLVPGDHGLLLFCDRALDAWYLGGGAPVDPIDGRAHDLADAVFLPGPAVPDARVKLPPLNPAARTIDAPVINLGAAAVGPADAVVTATTLHAYLTALITAAIPAALDGGAGLKATMLAFLATQTPAASVPPLGSTKVNAQSVG